MSLIRTVAPTVEPVTLGELRQALREPPDADDMLLESLIVAGREWVESYTGLALMPQTWTEILDEWPCGDHRIWIAPLTAGATIAYRDADGASNSVSAETFEIDSRQKVPLLFLKPGKSWPSSSLWPRGAISITLPSGHVSTSAIPTTLKQAVMLYAADAYEHPSILAAILDSRGGGMDPTDKVFGHLRNLCRPYRLERL